MNYKIKRWLSDASFLLVASLVGSMILAAIACLIFPGLYARQSYMDIKVIVEQTGYDDPVIKGSHPLMPGWYGCSDGDAIAYSVSAVTVPKDVDAPERAVDLAVCCGTGLTRFSKGCTVRVR